MEIDIPSIKSGIKTSEFYLSILAVFGLLAGIFYGFVPPELGYALITAILGVYGLERTILKNGETKIATEAAIRIKIAEIDNQKK